MAPTMNPPAAATRSGLQLPKFLNMFLLIFSMYQRASFGVCFSNKTEYPSVPYARIRYSRETQIYIPGLRNSKVP